MPKVIYRDEHDEPDEDEAGEITVGALYGSSSHRLAGLLLVLSDRELRALRRGALIHHAAPDSDRPGAHPIPIVLCARDRISHARALVEQVCRMLGIDVESETTH